MFGSASPLVDSSVGSVCSALHVPYFTTGTKSSGDFVVRMGPMLEEVIQAIVDLVTEMEWREVALVAHRQSGKWHAS